MAAPRFLVKNVADSAVLATSSALASLPVTNLQRQTERGKTWRTANAAAGIPLYFTWPGAAPDINMLAITRHNWTTAMQWAPVLAAVGSPTVNLYNPGALTAFSTAGLNTDIVDYTASDFDLMRSSALYFPLVSSVGSGSLTLTDTANPDGYYDQTRLWMGKAFELAENAPHGAVELTFKDASVSGRADDGTQLVDKRWQARRISIDLDLIDNDGDLKTLLSLAQHLGTDLECFISIYPGEGGAKELFHQMACRLVDSPTFNASQYGLHKSKLVFEET